MNELTELSRNCSSILKKDIQLPKKLRDPESCNISCDFGEKGTFRALCDLGSGVSLMPRKLAEQMNLVTKMKYTLVKLLLADRSVIKPQGVIEDVCVRVRGLILLCDFIVIEVDVDEEVPLILGRPFLATGDAWFGVKNKLVVFQVNGEKVILNMDKVMRQPAEPMQVQQVDLIEQCASEMFNAWVQKQDSIESDVNMELDPEYSDTLMECMAIDSWKDVVGNSHDESAIEESEESSVEKKS